MSFGSSAGCSLRRVWLRALLSPVAPPLCWSCGSLAGATEPLCADCRAELRWLGVAPVPLEQGLVAWAPLAYAGPARDLVRGLKFRGGARLADAMAAQIAASAPIGLFDERRALVPVPLTASRRRRRGFNQAEQLARALAARTGLRVGDCLARTGPAPTQVGRARHERFAALAGGIRAVGGAPPRALLVDDVLTTGATLRACAGALRSAGAASVVAVAYARTPGR